MSTLDFIRDVMLMQALLRAVPDKAGSLDFRRRRPAPFGRIRALEGEDPSVIREGVRTHLAAYEKLFRDAETKRRMKDQAAYAGHMLCRARAVEEKQRGKGTSTTEHLKLVLKRDRRVGEVPIEG